MSAAQTSPDATSATAGTIFGEMYKAATGVQSVEVVYRVGAESLNDQLSGRIDYGMFDPVYTMSQVRAGRLRALAVSTGERMEAVPDVPTMAEAGFAGQESETLQGVLVPAGTPKAVVQKLQSEIARILAQPDIKEKVVGLGFDIVASTPEQFTAQIKSEVVKWSEVVKAAGIKVE